MKEFIIEKKCFKDFFRESVLLSKGVGEGQRERES